MSDPRPRDALGRPLPRDARPSEIVAGVPERAGISDDEAWHEGLGYLEAGLPFHAHEVFEMRWRQAPADDRSAWRALAQWGAALTHEARGNPVGAAALADRALGTLSEATHVPECVDVGAVASSCHRLSARTDDRP